MATAESKPIAKNTWHHACQTWDNKDGSWAFYQDGELVKAGKNPKVRIK